MRRLFGVTTLFVIFCAMVIGCDNDGKSDENISAHEENSSADNTGGEQQKTGESDETPIADYKGKGEGMIHINQIGYRPQDRKIAVINSQKFQFSAFQVVNADNEEVVSTGELTGKPPVEGKSVEPKLDFSSGDLVYVADFSAVDKPGNYYVSVPDYGKSYTFSIQENVYKDVKNAMLKSLYFQRCGTTLEEAHAGDYTHAVCHAEMAYFYENPDKQIDVTGGWHDAGDYGRYVAPGANAAAFLLLGHELFPEGFRESINIPESGNGIPDILNEAKYELDWLLKMQDPQSGGAYHKVTGKNFEGFIMPEKDHGDLYVLPVSPTATGDFAAVMAMAARVYEPYDKAFTAKALAAAKKAWAWLEANPNAPGYKNPADVVTGEYGDNNAKDETYWAAVELYKTTGEQKYHDYIKSVYKGVGKLGLGWGDMSGFGTLSYVFMDGSKADPTIQEHLKQSVIKEAERLAARAADDGYGISMAVNDYVWGSNMGVMNQASILVAADLLQPNDAFKEIALNLFHYLLGRNALGQSYVTGFGSKPVMNPHHRPSGSDNIANPIPGLVSGGPNKNRQDPTAEKLIPANTFPARAFVDDQGSWSTNEITIYWNAPAIFVAGYLDK